MPKFILAYHVQKPPSSPEEGKAHMAEWNAWMQNLGADLIEPQNPLKNSRTVSSEGVTEGGGPNPIMGYSIFQGADLDAALAVAQSCPFLVMGTIEVAELVDM